MESALVSTRLLNSSKTLIKPSYTNPFLSKTPLNQTHQTNIHRCLSIPRPRLFLQNPVSKTPISNRPSPSISTRASVAGEGGTASNSPPDAIILNVEGMFCGGCTASVKRILESQPQVSSANVNLETKTAVVLAMPEVKVTENWQQQVGAMLANHLTNCGFKSNLQG